MNPLILRFGSKIPSVPEEVLGYDSDRQMAQVFHEGNWIDRIAVGGREGLTRVTAVQAETTDDT
jgi:hypothetical protein